MRSHSVPSKKRESECKPSNSIAKKKSYELNFSMCLTQSHSPGLVFPGVLHQFVDFADRAVVTDS